MTELPLVQIKNDSDFIDVIYKYTDIQGAIACLSNGTLKFTKPAELNDPFDVHTDDLFGMNIDNVHTSTTDFVLEQLPKNPALIAKIFDLPIAQVQEMSSRFKGMPEEMMIAMAESLKEKLREHPQLSIEKKELEDQQKEIADLFESYGVFCGSRTPSNLLLWAHYAESHKGIVFGFKANLEKDSYLRLMKPVLYEEVRPKLLKGPSDWLETETLGRVFEETAAIAHGVVHTKSKEWEYEQELRLGIPNEVPKNHKASFKRFYPEELVEMYIGYRTDKETERAVIDLAKKLNPAILIYKMQLVSGKYELVAQLIELRE